MFLTRNEEETIPFLEASNPKHARYLLMLLLRSLSMKSLTQAGAPSSVFVIPKYQQPLLPAQLTRISLNLSPPVVKFELQAPPPRPAC